MSNHSIYYTDFTSNSKKNEINRDRLFKPSYLNISREYSHNKKNSCNYLQSENYASNELKKKKHHNHVLKTSYSCARQKYIPNQTTNKKIKREFFNRFEDSNQTKYKRIFLKKIPERKILFKKNFTSNNINDENVDYKNIGQYKINQKKEENLNKSPFKKKNNLKDYFYTPIKNVIKRVETEAEYNEILCELCKKMMNKNFYSIHLSTHPSKIFDWLFLGSNIHAHNIEDLRRMKINYVLNCAAEIDDYLPRDIKYCKLNINDLTSFRMDEFFDQATSLIEKVRLARGKILVHCKQGVSRSVTIVIAYMIRYLGYSLSSALEYVNSKRKQAKPNEGFLEQLSWYEQELR